MLWHHNARVNSHQRWKQTRFRVCFHLWCELTSTMTVTEWQVSWNSWRGNEKWEEWSKLKQKKVRRTGRWLTEEKRWVKRRGRIIRADKNRWKDRKADKVRANRAEEKEKSWEGSNWSKKCRIRAKRVQQREKRITRDRLAESMWNNETQKERSHGPKITILSYDSKVGKLK